ncbi:MAG: hypothetical protein M3R47_16275, partial [Chloroflexota bacterium]|nr:hypothetical protein [Chloroflexota bacterium]
MREKKKSTDQRKPFGCTITRVIFPSKEKILQRILPSDLAGKIAGDGNNMSLRAPIGAKQSPNYLGDCSPALRRT